METMSQCDAAMVNALRTRCSALMAERNIQQDKRARYNYGMRLAKEDARGSTDFKTVDDGLVIGDKVSYEGSIQMLIFLRFSTEKRHTRPNYAPIDTPLIYSHCNIQLQV